MDGNQTGKNCESKWGGEIDVMVMLCSQFIRFISVRQRLPESRFSAYGQSFIYCVS